jgi:hypothetical protein
MKLGHRIKQAKGFVWAAGLSAVAAMHALAAKVGGKPEKADVVVTYAQPSGAFAPSWVVHEAVLR